jgi:ABC-type branched-subunit amino acid transport system substrate-binding protein
VKRRYLVALLAAAAAAVAVPTAWSGSSAETPVKVGLIAPVQAPFFNDTQSVAAAKAAIKAWNAKGGLHGHPIQLVFCNEKNVATTASACARQLVKEKVIASIGGTVLNGAPIQAILQKAGIAQLGLNALSGPEFSGKNVYLISAGSQIGWEITSAYAAHKNVPTSFVQADNPLAIAGHQLLDGVMKQAGGEFVNTVTVPQNAADYAPLVAAAQQNGAKGALIYLDPDSQGKQFQVTAEQQGAGFEMYIRVGASADLVKALGPAAAKMIDASAFPPLTSPNPLMRRFIADITAEYKTGDKDADPTAQRDSGIGTWLGYYVLDKVTAGQKDITAASVVAGLNKAKNIDMSGLIPPYTPNKPGPKFFPRAANQYQYIIGFRKNGTRYLITPKPITVEQAIAGQFK